MRGSYDPEADAAYLHLIDSDERSVRQAWVEAEGLRAMVVLDFDDEDRLLGIEIIGARDQLRRETIAAWQDEG
jgi:uncharacterized protein YuzE